MATIANPVAHPLGAPTVSGTEITVDQYSQQPTRVTRLVNDLTLQRFLIDRLFTRGGGISGGAVLYDEITENDLYAIRDVELVESGEEFPLITSARLAPKVATPKKWGGKFFITDEARDRNEIVAFTNQVRKVANTIVRKTDQYVVAVLQASIAANSRTLTGHSWSAAVPAGSSPTAPANTPFGDIAKARANAEIDELGYEYDTLLVNPLEKLSLLNFGQFDAAELRAVLAEIGINELFSSNRVTAGSPILVASGQVGEYRVEKALGTESWREQKTQKNWFQTDVRPVAYVTDPFATLQINGVA
jgi:hypothetical protein